MKLHAALAEAGLGWGGWKIVGMPGVLRVLDTGEKKLLDEEPRSVGTFLAGLVRAGKIGSENVVWRERVGKWAGERWEKWEKSGEGVSCYLL